MRKLFVAWLGAVLPLIALAHEGKTHTQEAAAPLAGEARAVADVLDQYAAALSANDLARVQPLLVAGDVFAAKDGVAAAQKKIAKQLRKYTAYGELLGVKGRPNLPKINANIATEAAKFRKYLKKSPPLLDSFAKEGTKFAVSDKNLEERREGAPWVPVPDREVQTAGHREARVAARRQRRQLRGPLQVRRLRLH